MSFRKDLQANLNAGVRGIWVTSHEEQRVLADITEVLGAKLMGVKWSAVMSLVPWENERAGVGQQPYSAPDQGIIGALAVLLNGEFSQNKPWLAAFMDPHAFMDGANVIRSFREILQDSSIPGTIVIISPKDASAIPVELSKLIIPIRYSLPSQDELETVVGDAIKGGIDGESRSNIAESALGLTLHEARVQIRLAHQQYGSKYNDLGRHIWTAKSKMWSSRGLLEVARPAETWDHVGGLFLLKKYIAEKREIFTKKARLSKVPQIRGLMLVGPPGDGKTLVSRVVANLIGWNYVRWDLGRLFGPYVGQTEQATYELLELTDALRPCVVQMDEMAHQVSGHESSGFTDSGVVSRMIGRLLSWMEDRPDGTLLIGTSNEPWKLPVHMIRPGRFDSVWNLGFPQMDSLLEIMKIHLERKGLNEDMVNDAEMENVLHSMELRKFVGAEVEHCVIEAIQTAYPKLPNVKQLQAVADQMVPHATVMKENLEKLTKWTEERARPAA